MRPETLRSLVMAIVIIAVITFFFWNQSAMMAKVTNEAEVQKNALRTQAHFLRTENGNLRDENIYLKEEIAKWREAAAPIASIFRNELAYLNVSEEHLLYELSHEDLQIALRSCRWMMRDRACEGYADLDTAPLLIGVFEPSEAKERN